MINSIFAKTIFYCKIVLGFFIALYIIYRRLFVIRLPKDLFFIQNDFLNYRLLILCVTSIIIFCIILYHNLRLLLGKKLSENVWSRLSSNVSETIDNALKALFGFIVNRISDVYDKVSLLAQIFYKYFKNISEAFFLFIMFAIRLFILLCFLLDVFVFFRLDYMYKSLYLLCFSTIIRILFYILKDFASNLSTLQSVLILTDCGIDDETQLPITEYELTEEHKDLDLQYHIEQFILCSKVSGYLEIYKRYSEVFDPWFNVLTSSFYLFGWIFIIFKNIFL